MTARDARRVAAWRYDGRWSVYDLPSEQPLLDGLTDYYTVTSKDRPVGFYCVGEAARVPGLAVDSDTIDVGLGMDPDLVGRGHGVPFGNAVLADLAKAHPERQFRAVVQEWNERSLRLTRRLGFDDAGELRVEQNGQPVCYRIFTRCG